MNQFEGYGSKSLIIYFNYNIFIKKIKQKSRKYYALI